jgi:hypothetical protein
MIMGRLGDFPFNRVGEIEFLCLSFKLGLCLVPSPTAEFLFLAALVMISPKWRSLETISFEGFTLPPLLAPATLS